MSDIAVSITRKFLDWSQPALPAVVDHLVDEYDVLGVVDLQDVIVVVPGSRAGRRLLELLGERAGHTHHPPRVITPELLPETLYEPKRPFASDLVQKLAWARALQSFPAAELAPVVAHPPAESAFEQWLALGELLATQHRELARDGLDFQSVVDAGRDLEAFAEEDRWEALHKVQLRYLDMLESLGLWDRQTARLFAIRHEECHTRKEILLVATADLNATLRQMLDQVADRVTALVHAPPGLEDRFDEHGCLRPEKWLEEPIDVADDRIHVVDGSGDQAEQTARILGGYGGNLRADEISIGVPDESLVPQLERQLRECGVSTRWVVGHTIRETSPFRLLDAVADHLAIGRFHTFAALVRHPDLHDWIGQQGADADWLAALDRYHERRLQTELGEWIGEERETEIVRQIHESVEALLEPLAGSPRPVGDWSERLAELLLTVYCNVEFDRDDAIDRVVLDACESLHEALLEHTAIPDELVPETTAYEAIRLALARLRNNPIPPLPDESAVEILGWLELPLDDARALVVTSFNEGFVPTSINSHLFLPNALRTQLGIVDNDRRYARDAYALSAILASRERTDLVVARRDTHDDPLAPSRLLFATDADDVADRIVSFLAEEHERPPIAGSLVAGSEESSLVVPRPRPLPEPVPRMSVTAFRTYLECPYRFYLKHVLNLGDLDDESEELDGGAFGSLLHDVLADFGRSNVRDSTDPETIRDFLDEALDECVRTQLGFDRTAPVDVQIEQMRRRLAAFADWQAGWAIEGWRIAHIEQPETRAGVPFDAGDGRSVRLVGRIDRIDRFRDEDRWTVFDYKTGETARTPERVHQTRDRWVDLQLPLYRHLLSSLGVSGDVSLGYIVLPKDLDEVGARMAGWDEDALAYADEEAANVVRGVLDEVFWPPNDVDTSRFGELSAICQVGVLDRRFEE